MAETFISVDIEASGPMPPEFSMLSLGACVVDRPEQTFYVELRPIGPGAAQGALDVIGRSLESFAASGQEPGDAMRSFQSWLEGISNGNQLVFVGFNAVFDWAYVNWYFHHFLGENPFGIGGLDIKSYYMGKTGVSWEETRSSRIPVSLKGSAPETHNALEDALRQAHLFCALRKSS